MIEESTITPAPTHASLIAEAVAETEKKFKTELVDLRKKHAGWVARCTAIDTNRIAAQRGELLAKWEAGEIEPEAILSDLSPNAELISIAGRRNESYHNFLEKLAAPIVSHILDGIADRVEARTLPEAQRLDVEAGKLGSIGTSVGHVASTITRHRKDAQTFRDRPAYSLNRLADYLDL